MNSMNEQMFAGAVLLVGAVVFLAILAVMAFVCWLLMNCLKRIPQPHRKMEPGMVWLLLIPCFGLVWAFFVGLRIPESFQSYFDANGRSDGSDYGRQIGLFWAIAGACSIVPFVNYIAGPASLILLIIFLVKMNDLKNRIPVDAFSGNVPPPPPANPLG